MKLIMVRCIVALAMSGVLFAPRTQAQSRAEYAFTHVNVLPMDRDTVLYDVNVIVRDGTVWNMGPASSVRVPPQATVIDARGKYLIPGLTDMHVHLEGDAWNIMFPADSPFTPEEMYFEDILFVYLAHGITMVDVMFAFPEHIPLREKIRRHEVLGPRLVLSRMIDGAGKAWPPPLGVWVNNAAEAATAVTEMYKQGYDRVKVYSFLDRPSYDTIMTTARDLGMPVDGHVPYSTSVEHVVSSGQKMIAHVEEVMKFAEPYTPENVVAKAEMLAGSDLWITSSLILHRNLNALLRDSAEQFSKPGTEYLHPMTSGIWAYIYQHIYNPIPEHHRRTLIEGYERFQRPFVREFSRRGGKLLTGTDALVPSTLAGLSLHEELEELVDAGVSPFDALRASTTSAFDFLGQREQSGTIAPGQRADLVLLDENPLDRMSNIRQILGVMTQNTWISRKDIDQRLRSVRERFSRLRKDRAR